MDLIRKLTFSKKFSLLILSVSLIMLLLYIFPYSTAYKLNVGLFVFLLGAIASYPLIHGAWLDIERHWNKEVADTGKTYRDFFTGTVDSQERTNLVRYHWGSISWTIFYAFSVYFYLSFSVVYFFGSLNLFLLLSGSLLSVSLESFKFQDKLNVERNE